MKNASFFLQGGLGLMKTLCRSGNMKHVFLRQKLITLKLWLTGKCLGVVFFISDTIDESLWRLKQQAGGIKCKTDLGKILFPLFQAVITGRGQLSHVQQLYDTQHNVTPLQTRTCSPSYRKTQMIHQSRDFWQELWSFCFAVDQRQISISLTSQQIWAVKCLLDWRAEAAAKLKLR